MGQFIANSIAAFLGYPSGEGRLVKALETSPSSDVLS